MLHHPFSGHSAPVIRVIVPTESLTPLARVRASSSLRNHCRGAGMAGRRIRVLTFELVRRLRLESDRQVAQGVGVNRRTVIGTGSWLRREGSTVPRYPGRGDLCAPRCVGAGTVTGRRVERGAPPGDDPCAAKMASRCRRSADPGIRHGTRQLQQRLAIHPAVGARRSRCVCEGRDGARRGSPGGLRLRGDEGTRAPTNRAEPELRDDAGFSRHQYAEPVFDQKSAWPALHVRAFEWFGVVPSRMTIDNQEASIVKA